MQKSLLLKCSLALGMTVLLLILPIVHAISHTLKPSGALVGRVLDESGLPLPGATILLKEIGIGTSSDVNGDFILIGVPEGEYTLQVSYIGYASFEQPVKIESSVITTTTVNLNSSTTIADEVVVMGDRLKGQAKALNQQYANNNITNIVAADQIGRFPDANIGDAMKRIPGITMQYDQGEARFGIIRGTDPY